MRRGGGEEKLNEQEEEQEEDLAVVSRGIDGQREGREEGEKLLVLYLCFDEGVDDVGDGLRLKHVRRKRLSDARERTEELLVDCMLSQRQRRWRSDGGGERREKRRRR